MKKTSDKSTQNYYIGYIVSLFLTLAAFGLVLNYEQYNMLPFIAIGILSVLALLQFIVQAKYFLHLDDLRGEKWQLFSFLSMLSVVLIIVIGSLWIMWNLNYNMMPGPTGADAEEAIIEDEGIRIDNGSH